ncbi:MAG: hypothetical protein STHCBS139747_002535 [Sporothrix thermara]
MVHMLSVGSLAARALVFMSAKPFTAQTTNKAQYIVNAATAINTLQGLWYDDVDGLWNETGWWNSANMMTTLADFAENGASDAEKTELASIFDNTFTNAQKVAQTAAKVVSAVGLVSSTYTKHKAPLVFDLSGLNLTGTASNTTSLSLAADDSSSDSSSSDSSGSGSSSNGSGINGTSINGSSSNGNLTARSEFNGFAGFINNFFDDEGWWALAWIRAFDVTGTATYLTMAESIFADMQTGAQPASCGGGIWWSKDHTYKNAIANELYLAVGASLANRATTAAARAQYLETAAAQWAWFNSSGLINSEGTINDGLTIRADGTCVNNNQTAWSYNQGVVLGGLVELHRAQAANGTADASLIPAAAAIANAAIAKLSTDGILHESCEAHDGNCGGDGPTFKGVFIRNLHYLQQEPTLDSATAAAFQAYILQNADSVWNTDRVASSNELGLVWSGPPTAGDGPTTATHGAAMDCLVAAAAVASK